MDGPGLLGLHVDAFPRQVPQERISQERAWITAHSIQARQHRFPIPPLIDEFCRGALGQGNYLAVWPVMLFEDFSCDPWRLSP